MVGFLYLYDQYNYYACYISSRCRTNKSIGNSHGILVEREMVTELHHFNTYTLIQWIFISFIYAHVIKVELQIPGLLEIIVQGRGGGRGGGVLNVIFQKGSFCTYLSPNTFCRKFLKFAPPPKKKNHLDPAPFIRP